MEKVSAYPFRRGECCNIAIKMFKSIFSHILSIVCAMKFAFRMCNRAKPNSCCSVNKLEIFCGIQHYLEMLVFIFISHLECLIFDAYFDSISLSFVMSVFTLVTSYLCYSFQLKHYLFSTCTKTL